MPVSSIRKAITGILKSNVFGASRICSTVKMKYFSQAKNLFWPRTARSDSSPRISQDTSAQADLEKWKRGYSLACDMVVLMMQQKEMEHKQAARLKVLLPHKDRCSAMLKRNTDLLNHFKATLAYKPNDEDAEWNVETLEMWGKDQERNLRLIDDAVKGRTDEVKALQEKLDQLLQEVVDLAKINVVASDPIEETIENLVVKEDMFPLLTLDMIEGEHKKMKVARPSYPDLDFFDDDRSLTSEEIRDSQKQETLHEFMMLKNRLRTLQEEDADGNRNEIESLTKQIYEFGEELCLIGVACKDGSMVYDYVVDPGSTNQRAFSEVFPNFNRAQAAAKRNNDEAVEDVYQGPGLFDNISNSSIEKPATRHEGENERYIVGEELAELKQKIRERVNRWQGSIEDATILSESKSESEPEQKNDNASPLVRDGLESLASVILGETLEEYDEIPKVATKVIDRCGIDAWNRRTDRLFADLPQEAQNAHPRHTVTHA